jgi:predicted transcriptional regulator
MAWKGHDWDAMDGLHKKGLIFDPVGKAKSVMLTEEGESAARNFPTSTLAAQRDKAPFAKTEILSP